MWCMRYICRQRNIERGTSLRDIVGLLGVEAEKLAGIFHPRKRERPAPFPIPKKSPHRIDVAPAALWLRDSAAR